MEDGRLGTVRAQARSSSTLAPHLRAMPAVFAKMCGWRAQHLRGTHTMLRIFGEITSSSSDSGGFCEDAGLAGAAPSGRGASASTAGGPDCVSLLFLRALS